MKHWHLIFAALDPSLSAISIVHFVFISFVQAGAGVHKMASFAQAFLRTSRAALVRPASVNPAQHALGSKGSAQFLRASRNYASAFTRDKPHVNIGWSFLRLQCERLGD